MLKHLIVLGTFLVSACSGSTDDNPAAAKHACTSPVIDADTGLETCAEGYSHRPVAKVCGGAADAAVATLPRAAGEDCGADGTACSAFAYGYCQRTYGPIGAATSSRCYSGCATDDDCGDGGVCICGPEGAQVPGYCLPSDCRTDADCGSEQLCASSDTDLTLSLGSRVVCAGYVGFSCQRVEDECQTDSDCESKRCEVQLSFGKSGEVAGRHRVCMGQCSI